MLQRLSRKSVAFLDPHPLFGSVYDEYLRAKKEYRPAPEGDELPLADTLTDIFQRAAAQEVHEADIPTNKLTLAKLALDSTQIKSAAEKLCLACEHLLKAKGKTQASKILPVLIWAALKTIAELHALIDVIKLQNNINQMRSLKKFVEDSITLMCDYVDLRISLLNASHRTLFDIPNYKVLEREMHRYEMFLKDRAKAYSASSEFFEKYLNCFCLRISTGSSNTNFGEESSNLQVWQAFGMNSVSILKLDDRSMIPYAEYREREILCAFELIYKLEPRFNNNFMLSNMQFHLLNSAFQSLSEVFSMIDVANDRILIPSKLHKFLKVCFEVCWKRLVRLHSLALNSLKSSSIAHSDYATELSNLGLETSKLAIKCKLPNIVMEYILLDCPINYLHFLKNLGFFINGYQEGITSSIKHPKKAQLKELAHFYLNSDNVVVRKMLENWVTLHIYDQSMLEALVAETWISDSFILNAFDRVLNRLETSSTNSLRSSEVIEEIIYSRSSMHTALTLPSWFSFFGSLCACRPTMFSNDSSTNVDLSERILKLLAILYQTPHYSSTSNSLDLLLEFFNMIISFKELQLLDSHKIISFLLSSLRRFSKSEDTFLLDYVDVVPISICEFCINFLPEALEFGVSRLEFTLKPSWAPLYEALINTFCLAPRAQYSDESMAQMYLNLVARLASQEYWEFWRLVLLKTFDFHREMFFAQLKNGKNLPDIKIFQSCVELPFFESVYFSFIRDVQFKASQYFNFQMSCRELCSSMLQSLIGSSYTANHNKELLVYLIGNQKFTSDYIDFVILQSHKAFVIAKRDLRFLRFNLDKIEEWGVHCSFKSEIMISDLELFPLNKLIKMRENLLLEIGIMIEDIESVFTNLDTIEVASYPCPSFKIPEYLAALIYFHSIREKCWLFVIMFERCKNEVLSTESSLTLANLRNVMSRLLNYIKFILGNSDNLCYDDMKLFLDISSKFEMETSGFYSYPNTSLFQENLSEQVRMISKFSSFNDLSSKSFEDIISLTDSAQYFHGLLVLFNTFSDVCYLVQEHPISIIEGKVNAERTETLHHLKEFCTSHLTDFKDIRLLKIPFLLESFSTLIAPFNIADKERLQLLHHITCNQPLIDFFLSKGCCFHESRVKFEQIINEIIEACKNKNEHAHVELLNSLLSSLRLMLPLLNISNSIKTIITSINEIEIDDQLKIGLNMINNLRAENLETVKSLHARLGSNAIDDSINHINSIFSGDAVLEIKFADYISSESHSLGIVTTAFDLNKTSERVTITQDKLLEVERVVAYAFPDFVQSQSLGNAEDASIIFSGAEDFEDYSSDDEASESKVSRLQKSSVLTSSAQWKSNATNLNSNVVHWASRVSLICFFSRLWEIFRNAAKLHEMGYPEYQKSVLQIKLCGRNLKETLDWQEDKLSHLLSILHNWEIMICLTRKKFKFVRFLSLKQILLIKNILVDLENVIDRMNREFSNNWLLQNLDSGTRSSVSKIFFIVLDSFDHSFSDVSQSFALRTLNFMKLKNSYENMRLVVNIDEKYLYEGFIGEIETFFTSAFVKDHGIAKGIGSTSIESDAEKRPYKYENIDKNVNCQQILIDAEQFSPNQLVALIFSIFMSFPMPHQLLWCSDKTSIEELSLFLSRAMVFKGKYVLVEVNNLAPDVQSALIEIQFELQKNSRADLNDLDYSEFIIYFIQTANSSFMSTPWLPKVLAGKFLSTFGRVLDAQALKKHFQDFMQKSNLHQLFRVLAFCSRPGDGKSFRIDRLMSAKSKSFSVVYIQTDTQEFDIIKKLQDAQEKDCRRVVFKISGYACCPYLHIILFKLFVLGRLSDFRTGESFSLLDSSNWKFYIEVPSYRNRKVTIANTRHSLTSSKLQAENIKLLPDWNVDEKCVEYIYNDSLKNISEDFFGNWNLTLMSDEFWSKYVVTDLEIPIVYYVADIKPLDPSAHHLFLKSNDKIVACFLSSYSKQKKKLIEVSKTKASFTSKIMSGINKKKVCDRLKLRDLAKRKVLLKQPFEIELTDDTIEAAHKEMIFALAHQGIHYLVLCKKSIQNQFVNYLGRRLALFGFDAMDGDEDFSLNTEMTLSPHDLKVLKLLIDEASAFCNDISKIMYIELKQSFSRSGLNLEDYLHHNQAIEADLELTEKVVNIPDIFRLGHASLIYNNSSNAISSLPQLFRAYDEITISKDVESFCDGLGISIEQSFKDGSHQQLYLASILSSILEVPLHSIIQIIEEREYILTLQYTIKLIHVYERLMSSIPVVIVGETGVGKTELINLLSLFLSAKNSCMTRIEEAFSNLINQAMENIFPAETSKLFQDSKTSIGKSTGNSFEIDTPLKRALYLLDFLSSHFSRASSSVQDHVRKSNLLETVIEKVKTLVAEFSKIFSCLIEPKREILSFSDVENGTKVFQFIKSILRHGFAVKNPFFRIGIHGSFTAQDLFEKMIEITEYANNVIKQCRSLNIQPTSITVFFDELNTCACLDYFAEIMMDRKFNGETLPSNIFFISAINPLRDVIYKKPKSLTRTMSETEPANDLYHVNDLPGTLKEVSFEFEGMNDQQLRYYISRKVQNLFKKKQAHDVSDEQSQLKENSQLLVLATLVFDAHKWVRHSLGPSSVSQRDIQRAFDIWLFVSRDLANLTFRKCRCKPFCEEFVVMDQLKYEQRCMLIAIGFSYFTRLSELKRMEFESALSQRLSVHSGELELSKSLKSFTDLIMNHLDLPPGVASSYELGENVLAIIICCISKIPLLIIGEPGTSKTLSFHIVSSNLKGKSSSRLFFQNLPAIEYTRFQGSQNTTSKELEAAFQTAISAQLKVDQVSASYGIINDVKLSIARVLFFDEVGLTSSNRQPLKVLHFYLDKPQIGFVGVSNKILDPARMNRAIVVLRENPGYKSLEFAAMEILKMKREANLTSQSIINAFKRKVVGLSKGFVILMDNEKYKKMFGLRDFYHFLRNINRRLLSGPSNLDDLYSIILRSLERNFNGFLEAEFLEIARTFFGSIEDNAIKVQHFLSNLADPLTIFQESIMDRHPVSGNLNDQAVRFKLIFDDSLDESVARLMFSMKMLNESHCRVICCSNFSLDQTDSYERDLVNRVILSVERGDTIVLLNTERIDENFYDLFNQFYTSITTYDGNRSQERYLASISIGGSFTRRIAVHPKFQCLVIRSSATLQNLPSPFLNRFEKYRLNLSSFFLNFLNKLPMELRKQLTLVLKKCEEFIGDISYPSRGLKLYGVGKRNSRKFIESIILNCVSSNTKFLCASESFRHEVVETPDSLIKLFEFPFHVENTYVMVWQKESSDYSSTFGFEEARDMLIKKFCLIILQLAFPTSVQDNMLRLGVFYEVYLKFQFHFGIEPFLERIVSPQHYNYRILNKFVLHTRSLERIQSDSFKSLFASKYLDQPKFMCIFVEAMKSEIEIKRKIIDFYNGAKTDASILLMFFDMRESHARDNVNLMRYFIDGMNNRYLKSLRKKKELIGDDINSLEKKCVMILHAPLSSIYNQYIYEPVFSHDWDHYFLDCLSHPSDILNGILDFDSLIQSISSKGGHTLSKQISTGESFKLRLKEILPSCFSRTQFKHPYKLEFLESLLKSSHFTELWTSIVLAFESSWGENGTINLLNQAVAAVVHEQYTINLIQGIRQIFYNQFIEFLSLVLLEMDAGNIIFLFSHELSSLSPNSSLLKLILKGFTKLFDSRISIEISSNQRVVSLKSSHVSDSWFYSKTLRFSDTIDNFVARMPWFFLIQSELDEIYISLSKFDVPIDISHMETRIMELSPWFWSSINSDEVRYRYLHELITVYYDCNFFERHVLFNWFLMNDPRNICCWYLILKQKDEVFRLIEALKTLRELNVLIPSSILKTDSNQSTKIGLDSYDSEWNKYVLNSDRTGLFRNLQFELKFGKPVFTVVVDFIVDVLVRYLHYCVFIDRTWLSLSFWRICLNSMQSIIDSLNLSESKLRTLKYLNIVKDFYLLISTDYVHITRFCEDLSRNLNIAEIVKDIGKYQPLINEETPSSILGSLLALQTSLSNFTFDPYKVRKMLRNTLLILTKDLPEMPFENIKKELVDLLLIINSGCDIKIFPVLYSIEASIKGKALKRQHSEAFVLFPDSLKLLLLERCLKVSSSANLLAKEQTYVDGILGFRYHTKALIYDMFSEGRVSLWDSSKTFLETKEGPAEAQSNTPIQISHLYVMLCTKSFSESLMRSVSHHENQFSLEDMLVFYSNCKTQWEFLKRNRNFVENVILYFSHLEIYALEVTCQRHFASTIADKVFLFERIDASIAFDQIEKLSSLISYDNSIPFWIALSNEVGWETVNLWLSLDIIKYWNFFKWRKMWNKFQAKVYGAGSFAYIGSPISKRIRDFAQNADLIPSHLCLFFMQSAQSKKDKLGSSFVQFKQKFMEAMLASDLDRWEKFPRYVSELSIRLNTSAAQSDSYQLAFLLWLCLYFYIIRYSSVGLSSHQYFWYEGNKFSNPSNDSEALNLFKKISCAFENSPEWQAMFPDLVQHRNMNIINQSSADSSSSQSLNSPSRQPDLNEQKFSKVPSASRTRSPSLFLYQCLKGRWAKWYKSVDNEFISAASTTIVENATDDVISINSALLNNEHGFFEILRRDLHSEPRLQGLVDAVANVISIGLFKKGKNNYIWFLMFSPETIASQRFNQLGAHYLDSFGSFRFDEATRLSDSGYHPSYRKPREYFLNCVHFYSLMFVTYAALWVGFSLFPDSKSASLSVPEKFFSEEASRNPTRFCFERALQYFELIRTHSLLSFDERAEFVNALISLYMDWLLDPANSFMESRTGKDRKIKQKMVDFEKFDSELQDFYEKQWISLSQKALRNVYFKTESKASVTQDTTSDNSSILMETARAMGVPFEVITKKKLSIPEFTRSIRKRDIPVVPSISVLVAHLGYIITDDENARYKLLLRYIYQSMDWDYIGCARTFLKVYIWLKSVAENRIREDQTYRISIEEMMYQYGSGFGITPNVLSEFIFNFNAFVKSEWFSPNEKLSLINQETKICRFLSFNLEHNDENDFIYKTIQKIIEAHNEFVDIRENFANTLALEDPSMFDVLNEIMQPKPALLINLKCFDSLVGRDNEFPEQVTSDYVESFHRSPYPDKEDYLIDTLGSFDFENLFVEALNSSTFQKVRRIEKTDDQLIFSKVKFKEQSAHKSKVGAESFKEERFNDEGNDVEMIISRLPANFHIPLTENQVEMLTIEYHALERSGIEDNIKALESIVSQIRNLIINGKPIHHSLSMGQLLAKSSDKSKVSNLQDNFILSMPVENVSHVVRFFIQKRESKDFLYCNFPVTMKIRIPSHCYEQLLSFFKTWSESVSSLQPLLAVLITILRLLDPRKIEKETKIHEFLVNQEVKMELQLELQTSEIDFSTYCMCLEEFLELCQRFSLNCSHSIEIIKLLNVALNDATKTLSEFESTELSKVFTVSFSPSSVQNSSIGGSIVEDSRLSKLNAELRFEDHHMQTLKVFYIALYSEALSCSIDVSPLGGRLFKLSSSKKSNENSYLIKEFLSKYSSDNFSSHKLMASKIFLSTEDAHKEMYVISYHGFSATGLMDLNQMIRPDLPRRPVLILHCKKSLISNSFSTFLRFVQECTLQKMPFLAESLSNLSDLSVASLETRAVMKGILNCGVETFVLCWKNLAVSNHVAYLIESYLYSEISYRYDIERGNSHDFPEIFSVPRNHELNYILDSLEFQRPLNKESVKIELTRSWIFWGCFDVHGRVSMDQKNLFEVLALFNIQSLWICANLTLFKEDIDTRINDALQENIAELKDETDDVFKDIWSLIGSSGFDSEAQQLKNLGIESLDDAYFMTFEDFNLLESDLSVSSLDALKRVRNAHLSSIFSPIDLSTPIVKLFEKVMDLLPKDMNRAQIDNVVDHLSKKNIASYSDLLNEKESNRSQLLKLLQRKANLSNRVISVLEFLFFSETQ